MEISFTDALATELKLPRRSQTSGENLAVSVVAAFNPDNVQGSLGTVKALYDGGLAAARAAGAKTLTLSGTAVINEKLRRFLTKQGFTITKVDINGEELESFSKMFDVN